MSVVLQKRMLIALQIRRVVALASLALNPSLPLPGATSDWETLHAHFPKLNDQARQTTVTTPNIRTPQRSLHELITSRLRKLLIAQFEESSKSSSEGCLFTPQESKVDDRVSGTTLQWQTQRLLYQ
jgi:hypothetical protein